MKESNYAFFLKARLSVPTYGTRIIRRLQYITTPVDVSFCGANTSVQGVLRFGPGISHEMLPLAILVSKILFCTCAIGNGSYDYCQHLKASPQVVNEEDNPSIAYASRMPRFRYRFVAIEKGSGQDMVGTSFDLLNAQYGLICRTREFSRQVRCPQQSTSSDTARAIAESTAE